jgi:hypothetical protein
VKILTGFFFFIYFSVQLKAQDTALLQSDTKNHRQPPTIPDFKKRKIILTTGSALIYGSSLFALNQTWYKNYPKTSFHTYNDFGEWLQTDKIGHAWSVYNLSRVSTAAWKWAGLNDNKATLIGSLSGYTYLTVIEFLDAHSQKWGWSWGDMSANLAGSGLYAVQQLAWKEQRIQFKFSAHPKKYRTDLKARADDLFGSSLPERILKDYNSQTYWLSANLKSLTRSGKLPAWLNLSIGYGADGMYGGYENIGYDKNGAVIFDRQDIARRRQWYLSPDIDLTKIKTNRKGVRVLLQTLNAFKLPAPALLLSDGKLKGKWIHF